MNPPSNVSLLHSALERIPAFEARRIRALSSSDYMTYFAAYRALRSMPAAPADLRHSLVKVICELMDAEVAEAVSRNPITADAAAEPQRPPWRMR